MGQLCLKIFILLFVFNSLLWIILSARPELCKLYGYGESYSENEYQLGNIKNGIIPLGKCHEKQDPISFDTLNVNDIVYVLNQTVKEEVFHCYLLETLDTAVAINPSDPITRKSLTPDDLKTLIYKIAEKGGKMVEPQIGLIPVYYKNLYIEGCVDFLENNIIHDRAKNLNDVLQKNEWIVGRGYNTESNTFFKIVEILSKEDLIFNCKTFTFDFNNHFDPGYSLLSDNIQYLSRNFPKLEILEILDNIPSNVMQKFLFQIPLQIQKLKLEYSLFGIDFKSIRKMITKHNMLIELTIIMNDRVRQPLSYAKFETLQYGLLVLLKNIGDSNLQKLEFLGRLGEEFYLRKGPEITIKNKNGGDCTINVPEDFFLPSDNIKNFLRYNQILIDTKTLTLDFSLL